MNLLFLKVREILSDDYESKRLKLLVLLTFNNIQSVPFETQLSSKLFVIKENVLSKNLKLCFEGHI